MDFGTQVGRENGAKIDPKRHRKSDGKMEGIKMAKKSQQDVLTRRETRGPEPWGGGRRRGSPSPREEGKGEVGSYQYSMLNHLSPGAGGTLRERPPSCQGNKFSALRHGGLDLGFVLGLGLVSFLFAIFLVKS